MFIDTHCHLIDEFINSAEIADVIAQAKSAGVGILIVPGAEPGDYLHQIDLIEKYDNLFATLGVHPEHANEKCDLLYEKFLSHPRVVGIGEIGLDYHYGKEYKTQQIELFEHQLNIAKKAGLPIAVHTRDASLDTAEILSRSEFNSIGGVMHCYTSGWDLAKKMLDKGFFFSASGIITFKNSVNVREIFSKIPLDKIVIETDSPFCAPVPYRGQSCRPFMVPQVARALSEIKGVAITELEGILESNTKNLYPKLTIKTNC